MVSGDHSERLEIPAKGDRYGHSNRVESEKTLEIPGGSRFRPDRGVGVGRNVRKPRGKHQRRPHSDHSRPDPAGRGRRVVTSVSDRRNVAASKLILWEAGPP